MCLSNTQAPLAEMLGNGWYVKCKQAMAEAEQAGPFWCPAPLDTNRRARHRLSHSSGVQCKGTVEREYEGFL